MEKPKECTGCPWYKYSTGFVPPYGTCSNGVMLQGMTPERDEIATGEPFAGRSGQVLNLAIARVPEKKINYGIINTVQCRPPLMELHDNENWERAQEFCEVHRKKARQLWKPIVTIALGADALQCLTGVETIERTRGYIYHTQHGPVLGAFHPSHIGRGKMALLFSLRWDLAGAKWKAQNAPDECELHLDPGVDTLRRLLSRFSKLPWVSVDIETSYKMQRDEDDLDESYTDTITRVAVADEASALSVQWMPPYSRVLVEFFADYAGDVVMWNMGFDKPRLENDGVRFGGRVIDAMYLWHFLQPDLPMNLAHATTYFLNIPEWKSDPQANFPRYNALDAWAAARCYSGTVAHLKKNNMLQIAELHVNKLMVVLEDMWRRGINVNRDKLQELRSSLASDLEAQEKTICESFPIELRKWKALKRVPPGATLGSRYSTKSASGTWWFNKEGEWGVKLDFNPGSSAHLLPFLLSLKVRLGKRTKLTGKLVVDKKVLQRAATYTGNKLLLDLLDWRQKQKIYSTYTDWPFGPDGRVHPRLGLAPATGRLSCRKPNFQNIPKEGPLAEMVRDAIIASPKCSLVAADFTGMESWLVGFFAQDALYQSLAKLNIYSYVLAYYQNWPLPSDLTELSVVLQRYKNQAKTLLKPGETKTLYDKFKTTVLGIGYGMGKRKLFQDNPGMFKNEKEAAELWRFVYKTFPKLEVWQNRVIEIASSRDAKLVNPYGYVRWFMDARGEEAPKALAQLPQSTGAAMVKQSMLEFAESWLGEYMVLQIHDELVFDVPESLLPAAIPFIKEVMERPRKELDNQGIMVSVKVGPNLKEMVSASTSA